MVPRLPATSNVGSTRIGCVQDALPIVIVAVVAVAAVIALITLVRGNGVYDHIRAGDQPPRADPGHMREEEIAQLLAAREARRAARERPPPDRDG